MTSSNARAEADFMRLAIEQSAQALEAGNMPFGAALVRDGALLLLAQNNQVTERDPMGHAEVVLLRNACTNGGPGFARGATVYASGEPCAMCTGAMFWAGVQRVVFAATQADIIAALGGPALPIRTAEVLAGAEPGLVVEGGVQRAAAVAVLERFARRARGAS